MFSCGHCVTERCVHNNHALICCGFDVDIIDSNSGTTNDFEILGGFDNLGIRARGRTHGKSIIVSNNVDQLFFGKTRYDIDINAAIFKNLSCGGGHFISN